MGNSLRCCLACVLPCGALDLIRIVHINGYVEEITSPITAGEILTNNPNHVLSKPSSQGMVRRILILSPESELKRGSIYFLIPNSSLPADKKKLPCQSESEDRKKILSQSKKSSNKIKKCSFSPTDFDQYIPPNTPEKKSCRRNRQKSRSRGVSWTPHLESILEDL